MQLLEDADQAFLVDLALVFVQVFPAALFLEHVVEGGHREVVVPVQAGFSVPVELLAQLADQAICDAVATEKKKK